MKNCNLKINLYFKYLSATTFLWLWIKILDFLRQLVEVDAFRLGVHYGVSTQNFDTLFNSKLIEPLHGEEKAPANASK